MTKKKQPNIIKQYDKHGTLSSAVCCPSFKLATHQRVFQRVTEIEKQVFFQAKVVRQSETSYWFYDALSTSSYSQTLRQVQFGYIKEDDRLAGHQSLA